MRRTGLLFITAALALLALVPAARAEFGVGNFDVTFTGPPPPGAKPGTLGPTLAQAGAHSSAMTTSFKFNSTPSGEGGSVLDEPPEDLLISQIPGFAGDPTAVPQCSTADFLTTFQLDEEGGMASVPDCPDASAVGFVAIEVSSLLAQAPVYSAVYNLDPPPGAVAKLGFWSAGVPVPIDLTVTEAPPYKVLASARAISQITEVIGAKFTIWGDPAAALNDPLRGHCMATQSTSTGIPLSLGNCPANVSERPFIDMPRACHGPLATDWETRSWFHPEEWISGAILTHDAFGNPQGMSGCGKLGFNPEITAQPTTKAASSPTGLDFSLDVNNEGLTNPVGISDSDIEKAVVTLPEGFSTNPSIAEGLGVCTEAELARETAKSAPGEGCPNASKVGTVEVETPILDEDVNGSLYIAKPYENPFNSLLALYIVIKNPTLGIKVVQAAKVEPNPVTGRLVTVTEGMPELPFSHFRLHFREGTRSPLASPPGCGVYDGHDAAHEPVRATLYPSSGAAPVETTSAFQIITGPDGGPCPTGGLPPFHPGLTAGTINNAAGHFSPFNLRLSRTDSEQEITHFSIKLPPGITGKLAGIPYCSDAAIAAATARTGPHGGQEELASPSCPAASEIGHTLAGAGVGPSLTYAPGKVYLAGPYHGSNLSMVAITAGVVGPFDIGTVVIREGFKIDPETAEVFIDSTGSDPIPHIIKGIPVHLRDIRAYVDRSNFVLNPTDCTRTSTASTLLGSGLDFGSESDDRPVTVSTPFQAADCAALPFKPKLALSLKGGTKRGGHPAFKATLAMNGIGEAGIGRAEVTLPKSEFIDQGHFITICTRVQFKAGAGNGTSCPAGSIYGKARATTPILGEPLTGPVFLRSSEHQLPDLVVALHNSQVDFDLVGHVDSVKGKLRNTFEAAPDAPVSSFVLEMQGGKKGLFENSTNLCASTHKAESSFTGQNGKVWNTKPVMRVKCGGKGAHQAEDKSQAGPQAVTMRLGLRAGLLAAAAAALSLLGPVPPASADLSFCPPGEGAGQCNGPKGVAVDSASGHVFVADRLNNRIDAFESNGTFLFAFGWGVDTGAGKLEKCTAASTCQKGLSGPGAGQLNRPGQLGVGNNAVYVFDASESTVARVEKFDLEGNFLLAFGSKGTGPGQFNESIDLIAVGPGGNVFVSDMPTFEEEPRVEKFSPAGALLGEVDLAHQDRLNGGLAVDSLGNLYAKFNKGGGVFKFHPDGSAYGAPYPLEPDIENGAVAVDGADRLFVAQTEFRKNAISALTSIGEYDSAGNILRRFGYGEFEGQPLGLAPYASASGDIFASDSGSFGVRYLSFPPAGPIIPATGLEVAAIGSAKATIQAEVNPEGKPLSYHFEYVTQKGYEEQGNGFTGAQTKSTETLPVEIKAGTEFRLQGLKAAIGCPEATKELIEEGKCLTPETEYRFRIVVKDSEGHEAKLEGPPVKTKDPLETEALFVTEAGTDVATLNAKVNPLGIPASGYFEYVDDETFKKTGFAEATKVPAVDAEVPEAEIAFGSGEAGVVKSVTLYPLDPATTYHYRLQATNPLIDVYLQSEERTFTTFRAPSPTTGSCPANEAFRSGPSALLPDCRAYELVSPLDKGSSDVRVLGENTTGLPAVLEQASPDGEKLAYGSYRAFGGAPSAPYTSQYIAARDAARGEWVSHPISPVRTKPLANVAMMGDTEFKYFSPDLCEAWIRTFADPPLAEGAIEGFFNVYRQTDDACGGRAYEALSTVKPAKGEALALEVQGVSEDGATTIFRASAKLATGASANQNQLYISSAGQLKFLCILPGGAAHTGECTAGTALFTGDGLTRRTTLHNALSANGSRIFWTDAKGSGKIYLRENPFGEGGECSGEGSPCTVAVSKAAETLSGTSKSEFKAAARDGSKAVFTTEDLIGSEDLYEFAVAGKATQLIAKGVLGVLGASEDASRVYFVSTKALEGTTGASEGKPNLYLHEAGEGGGTNRFIATLAASDANPNTLVASAVALEPGRHATRVSPDGTHAAFMSVAPLTGYDNADAVSEEPDAEVYLYDATADEGKGKLVCASCNPSGARPVGRKDEVGGGWTASKIPGWENNLHAANVLSSDGRRLYFESTDSLVPRDTDGVRDVYEWEKLGSGSCRGGDSTFVPASGGCVDLVSSGRSNAASRFIEATPDGSNVFIATLSSLVPQDYGLIDVYDARAGGGLPPPAQPAAVCEGEACQSPPAAPDDPTPASSSFEGAGNVAEGKAKKKHGKRGHSKKHRKGHGHGRHKRAVR